MKKVLVVLLIAVLAIGAVFADSSSFTGELTTTLKYDLDAEALTLEQDVDVTASFAFTLFNGSLSGASVGEGYPYAEVEGSLDLAFNDFDFSFDDGTVYRIAAKSAYWAVDQSSTVGTKKTITATVDTDYFYVWDSRVLRWDWSQDDAYDIFTKANIIGENWSIDLLVNPEEGNFASNTVGDSKTYKASKYVYKTVAFDFDNSVDEDTGLTVNYDGYVVGLGSLKVYNENEQSSNAFVLSAQSKDLALADGLVAAVGANYQLDGYDWSVNPSAKVAYDANDVNAVVAADFKFSDEKPAYDVSVDADYLDEAVAFDFYYATEATAVSPYSTLTKLQKALYKLVYDYTGSVPAYTLKKINSKDTIYATAAISSVSYEKFMSAKAFVDVAKFVSLGEVSALSVTVDGHDLLDENDVLAWNAEVNAAVENYGTEATFGVSEFTVDTRTFYAEATTDFATFAELPVNSLTLTVGSDDIDMDANVKSSVDCLYVEVASEINDTLTVGLTGNYLAGKNRYDILGANVSFTGVEGLTLSVEADHVFAADQSNDTSVEFSAVYTCDFVTVTGLLQGSFEEDNEADGSFGGYFGAESTALVNGATIGLYYSELDSYGDVTVDWTDPGNAGYFAAVCTLAF